MPIRPSKGVTAKYLELPSELAAEAEAFAKSRGESFKAVVEMALRRHLANPPPPPVPLPPPPVPPIVPLPPMGPGSESAPSTLGKGRGRKPKG